MTQHPTPENAIDRSKKIAVVLGAVFLILYFIVYTFFVPPNMDEFIFHHPIACHHYPNSIHNTLIEPCDGFYDYIIFDKWRISERAYHYTGIVSAILYYPLFLLFPSYHSVHLLSLLFFILSIALMTKLLQTSFGVTLLLSATSFPLYYHFIHDTGPIAFPILILLLTPYLISKMLHVRYTYQKALLALVAATGIFLAIEQKVFFLILMPTQIIFSCVILYYRKEFSRKVIKYWVLILSLVAVPTTILLLFTTVQTIPGYLPAGNIPYLKQIMTFSDSINVSTTKELLKRFLLIHNFADRIFGVKPISTSTLLYILVSLSQWILLIFLYYRYIATREKYMHTKRTLHAILGSALFLALALIAQNNASFGHHFIFIYFILHIGMLLLLDHILNNAHVKMFWLCALALIGLNIHFNISTVVSKPRSENSWDRIDILNQVLTPEREHTSVTLHASWGMYYIDALYGAREQTVLFTYFLPSTPPTNFCEAVRYSLRTAHKLKKDFITVYNNTDVMTTEALKQEIARYSLIESIRLYQGEEWIVDMIPWTNIDKNAAMLIDSCDLSLASRK